MTRRYTIWWLITLIVILPALAVYDQIGAAIDQSPSANRLSLADSPRRPAMPMAAAPGRDPVGQSQLESGVIQSEMSAGWQEAEYNQIVNLPIIFASEGGYGSPTATPSPTNTRSPEQPTATATSSSSTTETSTATSTIDPGATSTPTVTSTIDTDATPTLTPTATNTIEPGATSTSTPSATPTATPTATATKTSLHFSNCSSRTGSNATVAIRTDTSISGGFNFAIGDEVAVFTPNGAICAGLAFWTGQNIAVTVWGDDSQTPEIDGLRWGETMKFRIWDASAASEYLVTSTSYSLGNGAYSANSIHVMSAMTVDVP